MAEAEADEEDHPVEVHDGDPGHDQSGAQASPGRGGQIELTCKSLRKMQIRFFYWYFQGFCIKTYVILKIKYIFKNIVKEIILSDLCLNI